MGKVTGNAPYLARLLPEFTAASYWDSPLALAAATGEMKGRAWCGSGWSADDNEWSGSSSMDETVSMARYGWPAGAEKVARIRDRVIADNPIRKENVKYAIAGTTPNVPRAISGNPLSMRAPTPARTRKRPIITLIHNMGANWTVKAERLTNRAAAVAAIVDQIEAAGFSVEVIAVSPASEGGRSILGKKKPKPNGYTYCTTVLVKPSYLPTDIGRLAFGLGQASMFRRLAFADRGSEETARGPFGFGLGCTLNLKPDEDMNFEGTYILPASDVHPEYFENADTTSSDGVKFLINELKRQKCPAFPGDPDPKYTVKEDKEDW